MKNDRLDFRIATREQLQCVWRAISAETGDDRFFTTKELDVLPRELAEYEQVLCFSSGFVDSNTWLIVLTDQRILLLDKGMFFGLKQVSIELSRINSFESKTGLLFGTIEIGSNARNYSITNVWKKTVNPFTMKMREAQRACYDHRRLDAPGSAEALALASGPATPASPAPAVTTSAPAATNAQTSPGNITSIPSGHTRAHEKGDSAWLERLKAAGAINDAQYEAYKQS